MDKYEASVWRIPDPTGANKGLVKNVRKGKAELQDLMDAGATHLGVGTDDFTTCLDNGSGCKDDVYAVSVPGVLPSAWATWLQANIACANAGKRLPSNAEWQMAVTGSPDPGSDNGTTDCNSASLSFNLPEDPVNTGSRSSCVSAFGAYDMVGNMFEWTADWGPRSTACGGVWTGSGDQQCVLGAAGSGDPGVLIRGGQFGSGALAGPLAVDGRFAPTAPNPGIGFRCAR